MKFDEDFFGTLVLWGAVAGAAVGAIYGLVSGFVAHGIGGAIIYGALYAIGYGILGFFLVSLLGLVPYVIVIGVLLGIFWLISSLWNVGKP